MIHFKHFLGNDDYNKMSGRCFSSFRLTSGHFDVRFSLIKSSAKMRVGSWTLIKHYLKIQNYGASTQSNKRGKTRCCCRWRDAWWNVGGKLKKYFRLTMFTTRGINFKDFQRLTFLEISYFSFRFFYWHHIERNSSASCNPSDESLISISSANFRSSW